MSQFFCDPCQRQMFSRDYWESHLNGKAHRDQVAKQQYFCHPCQCQMFSRDYWEKHIDGFFHKEQLEKQRLPPLVEKPEDGKPEDEEGRRRRPKSEEKKPTKSKLLEKRGLPDIPIVMNSEVKKKGEKKKKENKENKESCIPIWYI